MEASTIKIEIWSDIVCPFCYIGKRRFEKALGQFGQKASVEVDWKSFQLSPDLKTAPETNLNAFLAAHKGISIAEAKAMNDQVTEMARQAGLDYHLEKAIVANSYKAHCFSHFAKRYRKQNEAEELLFQSYFTNGKNIDDVATLLELAEHLALDARMLQEDLTTEIYSDAVKADILEAQQLGVRGVPFFVFNRKYALSGAHESELFLSTLEKVFAERV